MDNNPASNAITEIALALSMAFFCLMILSMVSMMAAEPSKFPLLDDAGKRVSLEQQAVAEDGQTSNNRDEERFLVLYFEGTFLDKNLTAIDSLADVSETRILLAISPSTPLSGVISIKAELADRDVVVSTLSPAWIEQIERTQKR